MEIGSCPACARSYTASEVAGYGILRARPEVQGGPILEFDCPGCGRGMTLIPHGEGRYAPPGQPPPPYVPESERRPPWIDAAPDEARSEAEPEPDPLELPRPPPPPPAPEEPPSPFFGDPTPPTLGEALDILGVDVNATEEDVDRAFRERSRTCHPDKVAHLDPEFQDLAERKFRRLRAAYELLRDVL